MEYAYKSTNTNIAYITILIKKNWNWFIIAEIGVITFVDIFTSL